MPTAQHRKFDLGMNQDEASILLPDGYCYSSKNMLFDKIGIARKRGGITGVGGASSTVVDHLGALTTDEGVVRIYCGTTLAAANFVNTGTGAIVNLINGNGMGLVDEGRPFTHFGFLVWPEYDNNFAAPAGVGPIYAGGADGSVVNYTFTTPASVVLIADDKRIGCAAADSPLAHLQVGQIIAINNATNAYFGRVTRLISTTAFEVYPTPSIGFTATGALAYNAWQPVAYTGFTAYQGGKVGMSYQGRVCLGNTSRQAFGAANRLEVNPRRVVFSSLLLEGDPRAGTLAITAQGAVWLSTNGFPPLNYFDIPGQDPITAMAPTGFGDAVVFSAYKAFRVTGNLSTQFGTEQSVTWAVREIPNSVGCMSERSLQRTPRGLIFAHNTGVYSTDGNSMQPLMHLRMTKYWKGLQGPGFRIYGSAMLYGNHYYICGVDKNAAPWGLMLNLDTLAWGPISGKDQSVTTSPWLISSSVIDPGNPARVWGLKDMTNGGSGHVGGFLTKLDDIFNPTSANRADSDGATVNFEYVTPPYAENSPSLQKTWLGATVQYNNKGGAQIGVTPQFVIDSADLVAGGNTTQLPKQDVYTVTAGTGAGLIIVLTIGAGHTITQDSWVRVSGVVGNTAANGLWRVQAVTATTLTLMGSIGNAAYSSGGQVQSVDERDFTLLNAPVIGGNPAAVVYRINDTDLGTPGADLFELLSITHSWEDRDAHVE